MGADPAIELEVGRISRAHGLRGEVVVALTSTERSRLDAGSTLTAGDRRLVVDRSLPHRHQWIVAFAGVTSREDAEGLAGQVLTAPAKAAADDGDDLALWVHELVGAEVVEVDGTRRGHVVSVVANPASDLLELDTGALVPLRFVVGGLESDHGAHRVRVEVPDGLFDS